MSLLCLILLSSTSLWARPTEETILLKPKISVNQTQVDSVTPPVEANTAPSEATHVDEIPLISRAEHCQIIQSQRDEIKRQLSAHNTAMQQYYLKKHLNEQLKKIHAYCDEFTG